MKNLNKHLDRVVDVILIIAAITFAVYLFYNS
jgi:hypothetical protein